MIRTAAFLCLAALATPLFAQTQPAKPSTPQAPQPGQMTFEQYFRMEGHDEFEQGIRFLLGLAPARLHMGYLVDPLRIDLANRKGPSTGMACQLCAGVAATNALKILLKRGDIIAAPRGMHFDAYRNQFTITTLPSGNAGLLQRLKIRLAHRMLSRSRPTH